MAVSSGFGATPYDKMRWRAEDAERELAQVKNDLKKAKVVFVKNQGTPLENLSVQELHRLRKDIVYRSVSYILDPDLLPSIEYLINKKENPYEG